MSEHVLHFTLGPVQGFIARARRTRDLWAGSFLLSYLAGHAMYAVIKKGGKIIFPAVTEGEKITDELLRAIADVEENKATERQPLTGTLPNRFQASIPADFEPEECVLAVQNAWEKIAEAVWRKYVAPVAGLGNGTEEIWQRQIENFWEINWVIGEANDCLDRRKNWRSHVPSVEPGDKCILMGNLQELSGYLRVKERKKQDLFWENLRKKAGDLNIQERERLCAVSLVKRLFPLVAQEAIGWPVRSTYPSTGYIAAVHWLAKNMEANGEKAADFVKTAAQNNQLKSRIYLEKDAGILTVEKAKKEYPLAAGMADCDSNFFYSITLTNDNLWPKNTEKSRLELEEKLKEFTGTPPTFYAVLAVDGDRLGALLPKAGKETVSKCLTKFAGAVPQIVKKHNGVLIYAGGDDVLALAPVRDAVALAAEIRREYVRAFEGSGVEKYQATVSAGLVYAHFHAPLKSVLAEVHNLLDNVAKEQTGRDSLAVRIWNTGGPGLVWSNPWDKILEGDTNLLEKLVEAFSGSSATEKQYNSSFFYNLRRRFSLFWDEEVSPEFNDLDLTDLLVAEYLRSRGREKPDIEVARSRMEDLMKVCEKFRRVDPENGERPYILGDGYSADGAILVRFLAEKGGN